MPQDPNDTDPVNERAAFDLVTYLDSPPAKNSAGVSASSAPLVRLGIAVGSGLIPPPPEMVRGVARSGHWHSVQQAFLKEHPDCEGCGRKGPHGNQVHHVVPYHVDPSMELDVTNLLTGCPACHFAVYHLNSWSRINPHARKDAADHRKKVEKAKELP